MKRALQVLVSPIFVAMLLVSSSMLANPAKSSMISVDGDGTVPDTPGTPDSPMCLPDAPCDPVPNFR